MAVAGTGRPAPLGTARRRRSDRMWGGSRYFTNRAIEFIDSVRSPNPRITSRKRLTAFGNPGSDHWVANRQADAVDFGLVSDHEAKNELAQRFHFPGHGAVPDFATWTTKHDGHTYRHQVIAGTHGTGPHLHYGCRRVG